jgi:hypothetical protein
MNLSTRRWVHGMWGAWLLAAAAAHGQSAAPTQEAFLKIIDGYLRYAVKNMGSDAGDALTRNEKAWTEKACGKLKGKPIDQCRAWFQELRTALWVKYKPGALEQLQKPMEELAKKAATIAKDAKAKADAAKNVVELGKKAKQIADEAIAKAKALAREVSPSRCGKRDTRVVDDGGKLLFCGLGCALCKKKPVPCCARWRASISMPISGWRPTTGKGS